MKHIALCLNEDYLPFALTVMKSVLMHNDKNDVTFHLLTDSISGKGRKRIEKLLGGGDCYIYKVEDEGRFNGLNFSWSKYGWYRLFIPKLLSTDIKKVLYLDCDVCVCNSLNELFNIDMTDKAIAAAIDPESYGENVYSRLNLLRENGYICSGVLMMNLDFWRKNKIADKILDYGKKYPNLTLFPDQDAINVVCDRSKVILPPKYSPFLRIAKYYPENEWKEYFNHPTIVHYAGCAPWKGNPNNHPLHHLWWETFNKLPFWFWNVRWNFFRQQMKITLKKYIN